MDESATTVPAIRDGTVMVRTLLLGERLDTRGFERGEALATTPLTIRAGRAGFAVVFRYGAVVSFNLAPEEEAGFLEALRTSIIDPAAAVERDQSRVAVQPAAEDQVDPAGTLIVRTLTVERLQIIADILAKSLVLAHYETRIAAVFDRIEPLAAALSREGRSGSRGRDLVRQIGDVLLIRHRTVGRVEVTEKPDVLWDHPELERLHLRLAKEYELRDRSRALDAKLDLIAQTVATLLDLETNRSNLRVEWYIVALIVFEILLSLFAMTTGLHG